MKYLRFPFMSIIGQEEASLAIILNIINPQIGGILISGTKGTGKSSLVYGIPQICPEIQVYANCRYNCIVGDFENLCPDCQKIKEVNHTLIVNKEIEVVNIPLNISEDNLFGKIDVEQLLKDGTRHFVPGILAKANRQILYLDEVNLLPDHIIDSLLDVSASAYNVVERDGFSIKHKSNFLLIGTMNKEEGELRPQILDRFPMFVNLETVKNPEERLEIIKRNTAFENNPEEFYHKYKKINDLMKISIVNARDLLPEVTINEYLVKKILAFLIEYNIDGHRADLVILKTAKTYAALEEKRIVELKHIIMAMKFSLLHRTREGGLKKPVNFSDIENWFKNEKVLDSEKILNTDINPENISLFKGGLVSPTKK
ncbi:MAG: AAA family ATPase [Candidatus Cloacimonetes bacterium]|nr:AAA family ATPase [Candidatus Cloacimonadota bacterium]